MPRKKSSIDLEYARMYYEHQYDRMKAIEGQRWALTNIVVSLSVLAFTFGFQNQPTFTIINGLGLPAVIAALNLFAMIYVLRTHNYILVHQLRARAVLDKYFKELFDIDAEHPQSKGRLGLGLSRIQMIIHMVLVIATVILLAAYWLQ